ncbi:small nuclear ribonucleoprotein G-like [Haliotis rubra]|uniref:small nuclear ribonucleoprotein G-like n=1 Tax=Haliotis rubra TaxID=36100 RepID=UPI001EE5D4FF|nr:small nuclear ribonucleoprotein G-like [Haliotis rubra]
MSKAHPPELKKYMEKKLQLKLNGGRQITGILRGFDPFMNLVVDEGMEETKTGERRPIEGCDSSIYILLISLVPVKYSYPSLQKWMIQS